MIYFEIAGEKLDVEPGTTIGVNLANPLFSREIGYGSHSYQFSVPGTAHNAVLLGRPGHAYLSAPALISADMHLGGAFWQQGILRVESAGGPRQPIQLGFSLDTAWLSEQLENLPLKDLDLGGTRYFGGGVGSAFYDYRIDLTSANVGDTAALKVNGITFSYVVQAGDTEQDVLNELASQITANSIDNASATVFFSTWSQIKIAIISDSQPFLVDANPAGNDFTFILMDSTSPDEAAQTAMLGHMEQVSTAAVGAYPYCFAVVKNENFFEGKCGTYSGYLNLREPGGSHLGNTNSEPHRTTCVPFPRVKYIVDQALATLGLLDDSPSFTSSDEYMNLYLWNNRAVDREGGTADPATSPNDKVLYVANSFDLADHVPQDYTLGDLFRWLAELFNLAIFVDPVRNRIQLLEREIGSGSGGDFRGKSLQGYTFSFQEEQPIAYRHKKDTDDALFEGGRSFSDVEPGNEKQKIEAELVPLFQETGESPGGDPWKTPVISQVGETAMSEVQDGSFSPRCFFYHGLQAADSGSTYPAGSHDGIAYDGSVLISQSLEWAGADGRYALRYAGFEPYLYPTRSMRIRLLMSVADIRRLSWTQPYDFTLTDGNVKGLIKTLSFEAAPNLGGKVIANAEVILI